MVERSYNHQINVIIARHVPSLAEAVTRTFALGEASRLQSLFSEAGFEDTETDTVKHTFVLPSFDAYYGPFERGGASTGQALAALPEEIRRAVREEVRRDLADTGGPIEAVAEYRIDPTPFRIAVERAEAKLAAAGQAVGASTAAVDEAQAQLVQEMARKKVDLPEPEGPETNVVLPASIGTWSAYTSSIAPGARLRVA